jgi:hypothetical protein
VWLTVHFNEIIACRCSIKYRPLSSTVWSIVVSVNTNCCVLSNLKGGRWQTADEAEREGTRQFARWVAGSVCCFTALEVHHYKQGRARATMIAWSVRQCVGGESEGHHGGTNEHIMKMIPWSFSLIHGVHHALGSLDFLLTLWSLDFYILTWWSPSLGILWFLFHVSDNPLIFILGSNKHMRYDPSIFLCKKDHFFDPLIFIFGFCWQFWQQFYNEKLLNLDFTDPLIYFHSRHDLSLSRNPQGRENCSIWFQTNLVWSKTN